MLKKKIGRIYLLIWAVVLINLIISDLLSSTPQNQNHNLLLNEMKKVEIDLAHQNQLLTSILEKKISLSEINQQTVERKKMLDIEFKRLNHSLDQIKKKAMVLFLNDNRDSSNVLIKNLYKEKILKLNGELERQNNLLISIDEEKQGFEKNIVKIEEEEQILDNLVKSLFARKIELKDQYEKKVEESLRVKLVQSRNEIKKEGLHINNDLRKFLNPIEGYDSSEFNNKGVTYIFKKEVAIVASRSGKIIYSGMLGAYGQVLMLDHGENDLSVYLGDFVPKVVKGTEVKTQDIIGTTKVNDVQTRKLYFEVRKKNIPQNTAKLIIGFENSNGRI
jgi:murein DD-endopeptidase MepM/ murein hydrolase activator NlpD